MTLRPGADEPIRAVTPDFRDRTRTGRCPWRGTVWTSGGGWVTALGPWRRNSLYVEP